MHVAHNGRATLGKRRFPLCISGKEAVELFARGQPVNAHVNDRPPRLDHFRLNESGPSDGRHQNVGLASDSTQVARFRMADRYGGILMQEEHGDWLAYDIAAPNHHRMLTTE